MAPAVADDSAGGSGVALGIEAAADATAAVAPALATEVVVAAAPVVASAAGLPEREKECNGCTSGPSKVKWNKYEVRNRGRANEVRIAIGDWCHH